MEDNKILIIDDEKEFVEMVKTRLDAVGYQTFVAYDGLDGLKKVVEVQPDLIILDITMPKMGGLEFYDKLSFAGANTKFPVMVLTGRDELEGFFKDIKIDSFVQKPFETEYFLKEIERVISEFRKPLVFLVDYRDNIKAKEIQEALKQASYRVVFIEGLEAFVSHAEVHKPDVVLMEYEHLNISGAEFIEAIKKMPKLLPNSPWATEKKPLIYVYTFSDKNYEQDSLEAGADKYLGVPQKFDELIAVLKEW
ncbi:MAG: response regulator [Candidatus Omnitrophica bacterium]|nr:response regulator [Candidatus Omnitrophota bacterium]